MSTARTKEHELIDTIFTEADGAASGEVVDRAPPEAVRAELARVESSGTPIGVQDREDMRKLSSAIWQSSMKIGGANSANDVFLALLAGHDAGLTPTQTLKNIFVVNGRPTIFGDALLALVMGHPELAGFDEAIRGDGDDMVATCTMKRCRYNAIGEPVVFSKTHTFGVADAKLAGLWGKSGPWKQYPRRMLSMRCRTFTIRDLFPDVIGGLSASEEVIDYGGRAPFDPENMRGGALAQLEAADEEPSNAT